MGEGRYEPERPRRPEQRHSHDAVEQQDDAVRGTDSGDCRAGDPKAHERDLQRLPASSREIRIRRHAGRVGCTYVEQTDSRSRVGRGKDASPGERAAAQVAEMEEQRDEDPAGVEGGNPVRQRVQRCERGVQPDPSRSAEGRSLIMP